jgi:hypothetical protein
MNLIKRTMVIVPVLFLLISLTAHSSTKYEVTPSDAKLFINSVELKPDEDNEYLRYGDKIYVPVRFMAEQMGYWVGYQPLSNSIYLENRSVGGVEVRADTAKLFAYEQLNVKKIWGHYLRSVSREEMDLFPFPEEIKKKRPIYHVIYAMDQSDKNVKIYIWCDSTDYYYISED